MQEVDLENHTRNTPALTSPTVELMGAKVSTWAGGSTRCRRIRESVWATTDGRCWYCGAVLVPGNGHGDGVDHLDPVVFGGSDDTANLVPACRSCNSSKGSKTLEEYRLFVSRQKYPAHEAAKYLAWAAMILRSMPDAEGAAELVADIAEHFGSFPTAVFFGER